jgi:L-rhamnose-H+ transport protein
VVIFEGFVLTFIAGTLIGMSLVPLKWIQVWKWENFWFVYSFVSLLFVPVAIAVLLVPHLFTVYGSIPFNSAAKPFLCGALWGVAQLGAGICVDKIGLALTSSILNGLCATFGSLTPLVLLHPDQFAKPSGLLLLAGIAVMLVGVIFCGWAGFQREKIESSKKLVSSNSRRTYVTAMVLAVVSGLLAALLNIALALGGRIVELARAEGAAASWAVFAVWPIALSGALLTNLAYAVYLLFRNHTWANFLASPAEVGKPILAGALWMIPIAIYSSGTVFLGILGVSAGWALFQVMLLVSGNLAGIRTGEWRYTGKRIFQVNLAGVGVLLAATAMMGAANYLAH